MNNNRVKCTQCGRDKVRAVDFAMKRTTVVAALADSHGTGALSEIDRSRWLMERLQNDAALAVAGTRRRWPHPRLHVFSSTAHKRRDRFGRAKRYRNWPSALEQTLATMSEMKECTGLFHSAKVGCSRKR